MNRAFACLALIGVVAMPRFLEAQSSIPDSLRGSALAIRVHAVVPLLPVTSGTASSADQSAKDASSGEKGSVQSDKASAPTDKNGAPAEKGSVIDSLTGKPIAWQYQSEKQTLPGRPVSFRFIGSNFVVVVQITPFVQDGVKNVTLVAQGQVWVKSPQGGLSYHTAIDTLSVAYSEAILYYPLGIDASGSSPLRLEVSVIRVSDESGGAGSGSPSEKSSNDKQQSGDKPQSDKQSGDKPSGDKAAPDKPQSGEKSVSKP